MILMYALHVCTQNICKQSYMNVYYHWYYKVLHIDSHCYKFHNNFASLQIQSYESIIMPHLSSCPCYSFTKIFRIDFSLKFPHKVCIWCICILSYLKFFNYYTINSGSNDLIVLFCYSNGVSKVINYTTGTNCAGGIWVESTFLWKPSSCSYRSYQILKYFVINVSF